MKALKIIFGLILLIAAIVTMVSMAQEEQGAGLAGAITGFLLVGSLGGWLLYSGVKKK